MPLVIEINEECALRDIDEPQAYQGTDTQGNPIPVLNGKEIDLSELVRQLLNLHLPPRSLCKPDCAGLCPNCGQDLNEGTCDCEARKGDPRLAPLRALWPQSDE